jgi:hypothetical protein
VSDPGEVMSVESLGVESIAARWTQREGASPMNRLGIRMKDGREVASWDWVVGREEPAAEAASPRLGARR